LDTVTIVAKDNYTIDPATMQLVLYVPSKINGTDTDIPTDKFVLDLHKITIDIGVKQFVSDNAEKGEMVENYRTNGINSVFDMLYKPYEYNITNLVLENGLLHINTNYERSVDAAKVKKSNDDICAKFDKDLNNMKLLITNSGNSADLAYASPRPYKQNDTHMHYARTLTILVVYGQVQLLIQYAKKNNKQVVIPMITNPIYGDNGMDMLFAILLAIADYQKRNPVANDVYPFITILCQNDDDSKMYNTALTDLRSQLNPPNKHGSGRVPKCLWVSTLDIQ
jgi:hypothetical protein